MKLILTGFIQVFFVAINTYFIAKERYALVMLCSFIISLVWSFNVKRVVFGGMQDRLLYATGASIGGVSGLLLSTLF